LNLIKVYKEKFLDPLVLFVFIINKFFTLGNKILIRLASSEEYLLNCNNIANLGRLDNQNHYLLKYKNAGVVRRKGLRPSVRGTATNPIDHPHGGNTSIGRHPVSLWGKSAKGGRTRSRPLLKSFIYKRRKN
jgi:large subunit ribosomal protein L2